MSQMQNFMGAYKKSQPTNFSVPQKLYEADPSLLTAMQKAINKDNEANPGKRNRSLMDLLAAPAQSIARQGRRGDTQLAHVNPEEAAMLKARGGSGTINPRTGLREFFWGGDADGGNYPGSGNDSSSYSSQDGELGKPDGTSGGRAYDYDTALGDEAGIGGGGIGGGRAYDYDTALGTGTEAFGKMIDEESGIGVGGPGIFQSMEDALSRGLANWVGLGQNQTKEEQQNAASGAIGSIFGGLPLGLFFEGMSHLSKWADRSPTGEIVTATQTGGKTYDGTDLGAFSNIEDSQDYNAASGGYSDYGDYNISNYVDPGPAPLTYPGDQDIPDFLDLSGNELQQRTQLATNALYRGGSYRDPRALDYYKYLAQRTLQNPNNEFVGRPLPIDTQLLTDVFGKTRQDSSEQFLRTLLG